MPISVVDYDSQWPIIFEGIRASLLQAVGKAAIAIEHVGSTSVPGLAAKPIIDISVVVDGKKDVSIAIECLANLGYRHRGNLGVEGREAFYNPEGSPRHNLYVCPRGSLGLRNHLAVRDYLLSNAEAVKSYGELKKQLATQHGNDITRYIDGKTDFILSILAKSELTPAELESISLANRKD